MSERLEQQHRLCLERNAEQEKANESYRLQEKQSRKRKNRKKPKKDERDEDDILLDSCIEQNRQILAQEDHEILGIVTRVVDLYEKRIDAMQVVLSQRGMAAKPKKEEVDMGNIFCYMYVGSPSKEV